MNIEIRDLSPAEADARLREGTLTIVDVRPPQERELAAIALPYAVPDAGRLESLLAQPRDLPLGFLCHHVARSAQAADTFHAQGFSEVFNITIGILAWAQHLDPTLPRHRILRDPPCRRALVSAPWTTRQRSRHNLA